MSQTEQGKAYRAREVQVAELTTLFLANMSAEDANKAAEATVQEIEIRNAEEQRRKDAEIAGYIPANTPNFFALSEAAHTSTAMHKKPFPGDVPVYYSANVAALEAERDKWRQQAQYETDVAEAAIQKAAALEARVKVLEADQRKDQEVIHWLAEKLKQTDPEAKADYELLARAALTREGGV